MHECRMNVVLMLYECRINVVKVLHKCCCTTFILHSYIIHPHLFQSLNITKYIRIKI